LIFFLRIVGLRIRRRESRLLKHFFDFGLGHLSTFFVLRSSLRMLMKKIALQFLGSFLWATRSWLGILR
jgi:hypothetical protein